MPFDPFSWAVGYALKKGADAVIKTARGGREQELQKELRAAAEKWSRDLPLGLLVSLESLLARAPSSEDLPVAAREKVGNKLLHEVVPPNQEEWLSALLERWTEVRATVPDNRAPFFELSELEAQEHLLKLAGQLERVSLGKPWLSLPELHRKLDGLKSWTPEPVDHDIELDQLVKGVAAELSFRRQKRTGGRVTFTFTVSLASSYADLQKGVFFASSLSPEELLSRPGPRIIHGVGGAGKSQVLTDLALAATSQGITTFFLPLGERESKVPDECTISDLMKLSILGQAEHLFRAGERGRTLLLVDGLNEVEGSRREPIFNCLQDVRRDLPTLEIVVADRMNQRGVPNSFIPVAVDPLPYGQVESLLREAGLNHALTEPELQLLSLPFFIDLALSLLTKSDSLQTPQIRRRLLLERYLAEVVGIAEGLDRLAEVAYKAYEINTSRGFDPVWWDNLVEEKTREYLRVSGAVEHREDMDGKPTLLFRHQLLHDYLTGRYVASLGKEQWTSRTFDVATLSTSSSESLFIAGEFVDQRVDAFIEAIYDWNYPTSIEAVGDLQRHSPESQISADLRIIIPALNAEKLFDRFEHSRAGARRRMADTKWEEARPFEEVGSLGELLDLVAFWKAPSDRFERWRNLFIKSGNASVSEGDIGLLGGRPFEGWTAANVLRRLDLSEEVLGRVRTLYMADLESDLAPVLSSRRWRVVHLLGRFPLQANVDFLFQFGVLDPDKWVRYGAARSLMEIASYRGHLDRLPILEGLRSMILNTDLLLAPRILKELRSTTLLQQEVVVVNWYDDVGPLLEAVRLRSREESAIWEAHMQEVVRRKSQGA